MDEDVHGFFVVDAAGDSLYVLFFNYVVFWVAFVIFFNCFCFDDLCNCFDGVGVV